MPISPHPCEVRWLFSLSPNASLGSWRGKNKPFQVGRIQEIGQHSLPSPKTGSLSLETLKFGSAEHDSKDEDHCLRLSGHSVLSVLSMSLYFSLSSFWYSKLSPNPTYWPHSLSFLLTSYAITYKNSIKIPHFLSVPLSF